MKNALIRSFIGLCCAGILLWSTCIAAQSNEKGDWNMPGADPGQSGWQKAESELSPDSVAANVKFLWKIKLGQPSKTGPSFSEPLLASRLINAQGFKDIVYWSSSDTVYAVDSELGTLIWKKQFNTPVPATVSGCSASSLSLLMEPPLVINFNARRRLAPGTPRPPEPPPTQSNERRLGVAPGGGYFGLKGMYVLTADGMLHEQVINTGADFAPPVRFLPAANGSPSGLNFVNHTIYAATGRGCEGVPNGLWAIDLASPGYPVASYTTPDAPPLAITGPVVAPDGTSLIVTGAGTHGSNAEVHPGSVVAVSKDMKVQDWYTPNGEMASYQGVSPVTFKYKEKQLLVAPGSDGSLVLLDAASLGGTDHHTPLFETPAISKPGEKHAWDGFATWQDKDGTPWVFASISAGISLDDSAIKSNGPAPHGGVAAFRIEESNGQLVLRPVWISRDMVNPAPPRIANGVVIALSGGDARTHATLFVLNAATGAELYSSQNQIPTFTQLSGVSVGDGHAFFTDHNNVLYSFGIALEH